MDDEFRKPYEYEEERIGGFLLFFVIMLVAVDSFITVALVYQGYLALMLMPAISIAFLVVSALYALTLLSTVVLCYKTKKSMIKVSKAFLIIRAVFTTLCLVIIYQNVLADPGAVGTGANQFSSVFELTMIVFVLPLIYMLSFSGIWYLYFSKSKKCAELVKAKQAA
jgi:hypothetical protein